MRLLLAPDHDSCRTASRLQCNTRVLRDRLGWQGLLMDGSHERLDIGLHREQIMPGNINAL